MAHKLNFKSNGVASFASRKEKAWHGLGTIVDAMTSKEAIELGGLNFLVEKRPVLYLGGKPLSFEEAKGFKNISRIMTKNSEGVNIPNYYRLYENKGQYNTVRADTNQALGIVGDRYEVIQNYEAFDFIDSIIGEGHADYETVGALGNGETIFITCKLRDELIINKDLIDKYLLITMSHDGSSSITVMFTPIRVVCNNTLTMALQTKNKNKVIIRHTKSAKEKLEASKKVLGIVDQETLAYQSAFGTLNNIKVNDLDAKYIIEKSLKLNRDENNELSSRARNILDMAEDWYHVGVGQENIVGTGWGVFNGVAGYLQNCKEYSNNEINFKNNLLSTGTEARTIAYQELLKL